MTIVLKESFFGGDEYKEKSRAFYVSETIEPGGSLGFSFVVGR